MRAVTNSHLAKHGLTPAAYAEHWKAPLVSDETRRMKSRFAGDWSDVGLGQRPDAVVASDIGVDRKTVERARRERGIPPFVGHILIQEGEPCRSMYEAMYDAFLHWRGVDHRHEVPMPGLTYQADFQLSDGTFVEVAGMTHYVRYAAKVQRKRRVCEEAGLPVVWLTTEDVVALYAGCPVRVRCRSGRNCADCGLETHDIVKGVCRRCYMRRWHQREVDVAACARCGARFSRPDGEGRYCSRECYWRGLELDWPSWEWIDEQLRSMPIRRLAAKMGVKESTLYMRLRRRRIRSE